jgi:DNA polymerase III subunit delta'
MTGWDIFGHEWAVQLLQRHIASGEVRHAYLFTGPRGVGRRTLALRFTAALNCLQPAGPGVPCGSCRMCRQTAAMQQPDLSIVTAGSEGGTLKVEQIRELQHTLSLTPFEARNRVALLLRFEEAHPSAQNALLKTLEDAPGHAVLLLTALTPESLLPTITSRCEVLRLRPAPISQLKDALESRWGLEQKDAVLISHLSGGCTGKALQLKQHHGLLEQRGAWLDDMEKLLKANRRTRLIYAEHLARPKDRNQLRENVRRIFQTWLSSWRDVLLVSSRSTVPLVNIDRSDVIHSLAGRLEFPVIRILIKDLDLALERLDANLNIQLLIEVLLLGWPHI